MPRGHVKIEKIENKETRAATFSKRKAGLMKKAYELSALTGCEVLVLVASDTGHVYTFATPKLHPIVTQKEGKDLITKYLGEPTPSPQAPLVANSTPGNQNLKSDDVDTDDEEEREKSSPQAPPEPQPVPLVPPSTGFLDRSTSDQPSSSSIPFVTGGAQSAPSSLFPSVSSQAGLSTTVSSTSTPPMNTTISQTGSSSPLPSLPPIPSFLATLSPPSNAPFSGHISSSAQPQPVLTTQPIYSAEIARTAMPNVLGNCQIFVQQILDRLPTSISPEADLLEMQNMIQRTLINVRQLIGSRLSSPMASTAQEGMQLLLEQHGPTAPVSMTEPTPFTKGTENLPSLVTSKAPKANKKRKATTGWMEFCRARRDEVKVQRPDLEFGDRTRYLSEMWKGLSEEDRAPWNAKAAQINSPTSADGSAEEDDE